MNLITQGTKLHFCCLRFSVHSKQIKVVDLKNKRQATVFMQHHWDRKADALLRGLVSGQCLRPSVPDIPPSVSSSFPTCVSRTRGQVWSRSHSSPAVVARRAVCCVVLCLGLGPSHSTHPTGHPLALCGPFHVREAWGEGKTRRSGTLAAAPFLSAEPLLATHLRFDGGTVEKQEGGIRGKEESQKETLNYWECIVFLGIFKGPVCDIFWDALA